MQRRSIFGFLHNPDSVDAYTAGFYDILEEAREIIKSKLKKIKQLYITIKHYG